MFKYSIKNSSSDLLQSHYTLVYSKWHYFQADFNLSITYKYITHCCNLYKSFSKTCLWKFTL